MNKLYICVCVCVYTHTITESLVMTEGSQPGLKQIYVLNVSQAHYFKYTQTK